MYFCDTVHALNYHSVHCGMLCSCQISLFCQTHFSQCVLAQICVHSQAGTPYYTAPEMIQREPYSYPADCWSFGVIVHQLLALERPFEGSSTAELVKSILSGEIPPLPAHYSDDIK